MKINLYLSIIYLSKIYKEFEYEYAIKVKYLSYKFT